MSSQRIVKAINAFLVILVVGVPLVYWKWSLDPYILPKTAVFEALVEIIFALWLALAISDRRYRPRMTPLGWSIFAYLAILTMTAFTGVDPWRSLFSTLERGFGVVVYYHLAALALVLSSLAQEIPWRKLLYYSFGTSLLIVAIQILQLGDPNLLLANDLAGGRPGATFGNPTFLAGYLLFNIFLAGYWLFKANKKSSREIYFLWATIIAGVLGIFITETRGDLLGLFAGILVLVLLFAFRPPQFQSAQQKNQQRIFSRKKFYITVLAILIVLAGGVWLTRSSAIWGSVPGLNRLKDISFSSSDAGVAPRIIAFKEAWDGFLARPLLGWGFENFNTVFNTYYNPKILEYGSAESDFDKPHDIILEELDAGGVLLLLAYLAILSAVIYESWKLKDTISGQFVAALIAAYLVRSLVIFDTIGPALMLYLLFGFVDGEYRTKVQAVSQVNKAGNANKPINKPALGITLGLAAIGIYSISGTALAASYLAWQGHELIQFENSPAEGVENLNADAKIPSVYQWEFARDYTGATTQAYFNNPALISTTSVMDTIASMNQVVNDHPNDVANHYLLAEMYNASYQVDPQHYLASAEAQENFALELSPNRQQIYYDIAKTKALEGNGAAAIAAVKKAIDLDPGVANSHFYYGMLAFATGDAAIGYEEVEKAISMGRPWTNSQEEELVADYFADNGHLSDALGLYKGAFTLDSSNIDAEIKLGGAYYLMGNQVLAKQYLSDAAQRSDFATNPGYAQYKPVLQALGIR